MHVSAEMFTAASSIASGKLVIIVTRTHYSGDYKFHSDSGLLSEPVRLAIITENEVDTINPLKASSAPDHLRHGTSYFQPAQQLAHKSYHRFEG